MILSALFMAATMTAVNSYRQSDADVVKSLDECGPLSNEHARVVCYDQAVRAFHAAQVRGDLVVVDKAKVQAVRRQAFGFRLPTLELLGATAGPAPRTITYVLAGANQTDGLHWRMRTEDGAVWVQTDTIEVEPPPHTGSHLKVSPGALGSFFCELDARSGFRCDRRS